MKKFTFYLFLALSLVLMNEKSYTQILLMNEIYSRGTATDPDWIEIYNPTNTAIDLGGYKIYDSGGQTSTKPKKTLTAGTIIPAFGFSVIVTDVADSSGFGLSSSGEKVWLENPTGTIIDTVTFAAMTASQSYCRVPDGGAWGLSSITRGFSNVTVKMNEIFSRGIATDPDWIELYNASAEAVDISGYKIYDSGGQTGTKPKKVLPSGTTIPAGGFLVIVVDVSDSSGFGLSSGGETVWFENAGGTLIDSIAFPALTATQSYGRVPDGRAWKIMDVITRGLTNGTNGIEGEIIAERGFTLAQNYPNPFNPETRITFMLPTEAFVNLEVYTIHGEIVASLISGNMQAGTHAVSANIAQLKLSSGVYFYKIVAKPVTGKSFTATRKMVVLK